MLIIDDLIDLIDDVSEDFEPCIFKLTSGDIIASFATNASEEHYVLMNPLRFMSHMDEEGYVTTSLVKYMYGTDDNVMELRKSAIISSASMSIDLFNKYDELCNKIWPGEG